MRRIVGLICIVGASACVHEPDPEICPAAAAGDVVVTEIRKSGDPNGTWIELYNASGGDLDLEGAVVHVKSMDGATDLHMLVRRSVPVAAGDYVVLGDADDLSRPDHIDYGFGADFSREAPAAGLVSITACGVELDKVIFDAIPTTGTWSLGTSPPTADGNDNQSTWCTGADTGTPGSGNPPCV